jgi:ABC-type sulfate/molybdate transport systems ATPase subunit
MCDLLQEVRKRTGVTTLHVTHNEAEALTLASDVFRIHDGRIVPPSSVGAPQSVSAPPRHSTAIATDEHQRQI